MIDEPISLARICASVVLPSPGGPYSRHVVERFAARARRFHGDLQVFLHAILPDVIAETRWADARLDARVLIGRPSRKQCDSVCRSFRYAHGRYSRYSSPPRARALLHRRVAQNLQRRAQQVFEFPLRRRARLLDGVFDRTLIVAEIHERGGHVGLESATA